MAVELTVVAFRAGDTKPEHTVLLLVLTTSISFSLSDINECLQMPGPEALEQQWHWALEVRLSLELIHCEKIQWGGWRCCWDVGMINVQLSLHFYIGVHQSMVKICTPRAWSLIEGKLSSLSPMSLFLKSLRTTSSRIGTRKANNRNPKHTGLFFFLHILGCLSLNEYPVNVMWCNK